MPISLRIGELAKQQGMTIKALAERAGVAYNTAHTLYTSRATRIDLDTLDRISAALHVEPGEIFVRYGSREPAGRQEDREASFGVDRERQAGVEERRIEEHA